EHQSGLKAEAEAHFREAEDIQAKLHPEYPLLYSLWGYRYCDLLLAPAEVAAWRAMIFTNGSSLSFQSVPANLSSQDGGEDRSTITPFLEFCYQVSERTKKTRGWEGTVFLDGLLEAALDGLTVGR